MPKTWSMDKSSEKTTYNFLRSKRLHLNLKVPLELPHRENLQVLEDLELQKLQAEEDILLKDIIERFHPFKASIGSKLHQKYQKATEKRKQYFWWVYDRAYQKYRRDYFHNTGLEEVRWQILQGPAPKPTNDCALEDSELSSLLTFVSSAYFPERSFIANALFKVCSTTQNGLQDHRLVEQMQTMCISDSYVLYFPREVPIGGRCPSCQVLMTDLVHKPH